MPTRDNVAAVIATNLRRLRQMLGATQDEVARVLRDVGMPWTRSVVAAVETERRTVTMEELLAMAMALGTSPPELLAHDRPVRLYGTELGPGALADLVRGASGAAPVTPRRPRGWRDTERTTVARLERVGLRATYEAVDRVKRWAGLDAERHAAKRLGLDPEDIAVLALKRWGSSLTETREATTVAPRANYRGHASRALLRQLADDAAEAGLGRR